MTQTENKLKELKANTLYTVDTNGTGRVYIAKDSNGEEFQDEISYDLRVKAFENKQKIYFDGTNFTLVSLNFSAPFVFDGTKSIREIIDNSYDFKPADIMIDKLKWKFLVRNVLKSKNIMMTGASGAGKTVTAQAVAKAMKREFFYFNLGATQDPRSTLIGNTYFSKERGTYFVESLFVKAIQTPNAVILLDELSRAHPEASNILMPVLDKKQRYLRLDEQEGQPTIDVAEGVSFIATANIGSEYTSTRTFDRATKDRFVIIEMEMLTAEQEVELLKVTFEEEMKDEKLLSHVDILTKISEAVRNDWRDGEVTTMFSTRMVIECTESLIDGFKLMEALEVTLLPLFDADGGADSDRTKVMQIIQKFIPNEDLGKDNIYDQTSGSAKPNPF